MARFLKYRFLKYAPAGLLCVVTLSSASSSSAWAWPQDANQAQPAPAPPVAPVTPQSPAPPFTAPTFTFTPAPVTELPLQLSQRWPAQQTSWALSTQCYTMRIVPVDPTVDTGIAVQPRDPKTDFTGRIVPAPPCVVPGVTPGTAPGRGVPLPALPRYKVLPTQRDLPTQYFFLPYEAPLPTIPGQGGDGSR